MKKLVSLAVVINLMLLFLSSSISANSGSNEVCLRIGSKMMTVNGTDKELDTAPIVKDNRAMVPIKSVIESVYGTVSFDSTEGRVDIQCNDNTIKMWIGKKNTLVNMVNMITDIAPSSDNGVIMVPFRFVAENLGLVVSWNSSDSSIKVTVPSGEIKLLGYAQFGKYYGDPILWRCYTTKSGVGMTLVSEYILCQKAFDAAESGTAAGNDGIRCYGSSAWGNSNIREWLNSELQKVDYTTQEPISSAIYMGKYAYADEPGFLSNFTQDEISYIKPVWHDNKLDKVFLLSRDEGNIYSVRYPNQKMTSTAIVKFDGGSSDFWFRNSADSVRVNIACNNLNGADIACLASGILPALNIKSNIFKSGKGTTDEPWKVN